MGILKSIAIALLFIETIAEWPLLMSIHVAAANHVIFAIVLFTLSYFPKAPFITLSYVVWKPPKHAFLMTLEKLGFYEGGVKKDSYAAKYQSKRYGATVPRDSWFAKSQSFGAYGERKFPSQYDEETLESVGFWWNVIGWAFFVHGLNHLAVAAIV